MNFFTVGFLLANLQLDLGLWIGYAVKLAGGLFMLGGIAEMSLVDESVARLRAQAILFALLSGGAIAAVSLTEGAGLKTASIVSGAVTTAAAGLFFRQLLGLMKEKPQIVDNIPEVGRLAPKYDRMLIVLGVVLAADCINRFTGGTAAADATGVVMYFTKIISYVYLIVCEVGFNKLRISFNSAHPAG